MPIVLITIVVGLLTGYWLCRMQLRGKWLIVEERERKLDTQSWCRPEDAPLALPLTEQWHLPGSPYLIRTPRCPDGFGAAQVIGDKWYGVPPLYPGGIEEWKETHPMKGRDK